jgi:hypothetical protein
MRNLLFFSRVAFICNICFVLAWLMKYSPQLPSAHLVSMILILGLLISFILNIIVNSVVVTLLLSRKPVFNIFPGWLIIINFLFLFPQIILFVR